MTGFWPSTQLPKPSQQDRQSPGQQLQNSMSQHCLKYNPLPTATVRVTDDFARHGQMTALQNLLPTLLHRNSPWSFGFVNLLFLVRSHEKNAEVTTKSSHVHMDKGFI